MGREINRKLTEWGHTGRVYVVGDATSQKEDVKQEKGSDLFVLVMKEFANFKPVKRVPASNPSVKISGDFFNSLLDGNVPGMSFGADKGCRVAINDFEKTKEDKNGKIDKSVVRDPVTGQSYQPFGHFVDLTRYFLCTVFANEYAIYQKAGTGAGQTKSGKTTSKNQY